MHKVAQAGEGSAYFSMLQDPVPAVQVVFFTNVAVPRVFGVKATGVLLLQSLVVSLSGTAPLQALGAKAVLLRPSDISTTAVFINALASDMHAPLEARCM